MSQLKRYKLLKDLPNCPAGRFFAQNYSGNYYHYMTDVETLDNMFKLYIFSKKEVEENPDWFELQEDFQN